VNTTEGSLLSHGYGGGFPDMIDANADWTRREELTGLLRACRGRIASMSARARGGGLRQADVAGLAGLSLRTYAKIERGEVVPPTATVDLIAAALGMSDAERSAAHVLATGQDPPRPVGRAVGDPPHEPSQALRDLVTQLGDFPAALTDETWTLLAHNPAMAAWAGGWYDTAAPDERNLILYLFSKQAEELLPDLHALRRDSIASWHYQYCRNLESPRFAGLVTRLTQTGAEAAGLWSRHEMAWPPHEYPIRVRHPDHGLVDAHVAFSPIHPRLWLYVMITPPGISTPAS
jgi:transcriptional regulator with XRE-family HTH domain